jgi:hypothetical protein
MYSRRRIRWVSRANAEGVFTNGIWSFPEKLDPAVYIGFVYMIADLRTGLRYIGKKLMRGTGTSNLNQESNWRQYKSSHPELKAAISLRGTGEFDFIVLEQYGTKGGLSYAESWSLMRAEIPSSPGWYNTAINAVTWHSREAVSWRHKTRLDTLLAGGTLQDGIL